MAAKSNKDNFAVLLWEILFFSKKKKGHLLVQSRKRHFLQISELFQAIKGRDGAVCFQSVTSALLFYPQFKRS